MQKINILFLNQHISTSKAAKVLSEKDDLFILNFRKELLALMTEKEENELAISIKSFIDNADKVPEHLLDEFLKFTLTNSRGRDILLVGSPRTIEHFFRLENSLKDLNVEIHTMWYLKQKNRDEYMTEHFKNPNAKMWLNKYGDEVIEKWKQDFEKNQIFVSELQKMTENRIWNIIEIDCETEVNEEFLIKTINDCA